MTKSSIAVRLWDLSARVADAALAADRSPDEVQIMLATKTVAPELILEAADAGFKLIGENRVQELVAKDEALAGSGIVKHFIGHLQRNKINHVLRTTSVIQSIDSAELLDQVAQRLPSGATFGVMIQVNTSGESSKFGIEPERAVELAAEATQRPEIDLKGFMTIGLNSQNEAAVRASYRKLRELKEDFVRQLEVPEPFPFELSMGMSADFAWAIAEGATMIRLGSAVFGSR